MHGDVRDSYEATRLRTQYKQAHGMNARDGRRPARLPGILLLVAAAAGFVAVLLGLVL